MSHYHEFRKLGKQSARRDYRNMMLAHILRARTTPAAYDWDTAHPGLGFPMFKNDTLGCCVIAERGHQTRRFKFAETGTKLTISDKEITNEYFKETGGPDSGLVILDSLNAWRRGWKAGGKTLKIKAFAEINRGLQEEVKTTVFSDIGCAIGVELPISAATQIDAGKVWDVVTGKNGKVGSWGGHCVMVDGYEMDGKTLLLNCITWGQKQRMTWAFWLKYCSEAYAVFDDATLVSKSRRFDKQYVDNFVAAIAA